MAGQSFSIGKSHALDEAILKVRIGSQPYMLDKIEYGKVLDAYEKFGPAQGGVAGRNKVTYRCLEKADPHSTFRANVIAECTRQIDLFDIVNAGTPAIEQDAQAGGDSAFGQLKFAHIGLPKLDAAADRKLLGAGSETAANADDAAVESGSNGVNQSAAADTARLLLHQSRCIPFRYCGSRRRARSHRWPRAFPS